MATVYLAEDVKHHRRVAIKVLHPELSAILGTERFLKERRWAAPSGSLSWRCWDPYPGDCLAQRSSYASDKGPVFFRAWVPPRH
jgi:hypothetical protein